MDPPPQFFDPNVEGERADPELRDFKKKLGKVSEFRDKDYMEVCVFIREYLANSDDEAFIEGEDDSISESSGDDESQEDSPSDDNVGNDRWDHTQMLTEDLTRQIAPGINCLYAVTEDDPFDIPTSEETHGEQKEGKEKLLSVKAKKSSRRRLPKEERQQAVFDLLWKELQTRAEGREYCNWDDDLDDENIDEKEAHLKNKSTVQMRVILALADDCFEYVHSIWRLLWIVADDEDLTCIPALWNRWKSRIAVDVNVIHEADIQQAKMQRKKENEEWARLEKTNAYWQKSKEWTSWQWGQETVDQGNSAKYQKKVGQGYLDGADMQQMDVEGGAEWEQDAENKEGENPIQKEASGKGAENPIQRGGNPAHEAADGGESPLDEVDQDMKVLPGLKEAPAEGESVVQPEPLDVEQNNAEEPTECEEEENIVTDVWSRTSVADSLKYLEKVEPELYEQMACLQERINLTFDPFSTLVGAKTFDEEAELAYAALAYGTEDMYLDEEFADNSAGAGSSDAIASSSEDDDTSDEDSDDNDDADEGTGRKLVLPDHNVQETMDVEDDDSLEPPPARADDSLAIPAPNKDETPLRPASKKEKKKHEDDPKADSKSDFLREQITVDRRFLNWDADWGPLPTAEDMAMMAACTQGLEPESKANVPGKRDRKRGHGVFNRKLNQWAKDTQAAGNDAYELPLVLFNHLPILENSSWDFEDFVPILEEHKRNEAAELAKEASVVAKEVKKRKKIRKAGRIARMKADAEANGEEFEAWWHEDEEDERSPEERLLDRIRSKKSRLDGRILNKKSRHDEDTSPLIGAFPASSGAGGVSNAQNIGSGSASMKDGGLKAGHGEEHDNEEGSSSDSAFYSDEVCAEADEEATELDEGKNVNEEQAPFEEDTLSGISKYDLATGELAVTPKVVYHNGGVLFEKHPFDYLEDAEEQLVDLFEEAKVREEERIKLENEASSSSSDEEGAGHEKMKPRVAPEMTLEEINPDSLNLAAARHLKDVHVSSRYSKMTGKSGHGKKRGLQVDKAAGIVRRRELGVAVDAKSVKKCMSQRVAGKMPWQQDYNSNSGYIPPKIGSIPVTVQSVCTGSKHSLELRGPLWKLKYFLSATEDEEISEILEEFFDFDVDSVSIAGNGDHMRRQMGRRMVQLNVGGARKSATENVKKVDVGEKKLDKELDNDEDEDDDLGDDDEPDNDDLVSAKSHLGDDDNDQFGGPDTEELVSAKRFAHLVDDDNDQLDEPDNDERKSVSNNTPNSSDPNKSSGNGMCDMSLDAASPTEKTDAGEPDSGDLPLVIDDPGSDRLVNPNSDDASNASSPIELPISPVELPSFPKDSQPREVHPDSGPESHDLRSVECGVSQRMRQKWQSYTFDSQNSVYPIFTPTANRCKGALLHYDGLHAFGEFADFVPHVIVVEPSQYAHYVAHFPEHLFLILDDDGRGVGYSRYIIQLFATNSALILSHKDLNEWKEGGTESGEFPKKQRGRNSCMVRWRSSIIWVLDDQVCRFYKREEVETTTENNRGKLKKKKALARAECSFRDALLHVQRHPALKKMGVAGFLRENGATLCNLGMREWNTNAFKVYKAVALNIRVLERENVFYIPYMRMFEDLSFLFKITRQRTPTLKCQSHFYVAIHTKGGGCADARKADKQKKDDDNTALMTRDRIVPDEYFKLLSYDDQDVVTSIMNWVANQENNFMNKLADEKLIAAIRGQMQERKQKEGTQ